MKIEFELEFEDWALFVIHVSRTDPASIRLGRMFRYGFGGAYIAFGIYGDVFRLSDEMADANGFHQLAVSVLITGVDLGGGIEPDQEALGMNIGHIPG